MRRPEYAILVGGEVFPTDDLTEWAKWFEHAREQRIIGKTPVFDYIVSTVFLGLNHQWRDHEPPLWFETMTFGKTGHAVDLDDLGCARYTTRLEAEQGHARTVERLHGLVCEIEQIESEVEQRGSNDERDSAAAGPD